MTLRLAHYLSRISPDVALPALPKRASACMCECVRGGGPWLPVGSQSKSSLRNPPRLRLPRPRLS